MTPRRLAALVVAHARPETTSATIEAILGQSRTPDELILVANGATREVIDVLNGWAIDFPKTTVLELPENTGAAGGFRAGLAFACESQSIDWVCCFDDDALPLPGCMEALAGAVHELPRAGSLGPLTHTGSGTLSWPLFVRGRTRPIRTTREACSVAGESGVLSVYAMSWHALLVRVDAVRAAGNVDERLFHQYEDAEFGFRLLQAGFSNYTITDAECLHPPAPESREIKILRRSLRITADPPHKEYLNIRNDIVVRRRYEGRRFWYGALPLILLRGLAGCLRSDMRTADAFRKIYLRAIRDAAFSRLGPPPTSLR